MRTTHAPRALALLGSIVVAGVWIADAGDLNPPPGPIGPTMKSLAEVEPRINVNSLPGDATALHVITQDGSYYLTANIVGVAGKHGIKVQTPKGALQINFNGFVLLGVPGSLSAVKVEPPTAAPAATFVGVPCPSVINSISGWGGYGIDATGIASMDIRDLMVKNCAMGGIVTGDAPYMPRVMVENCGGPGIATGADAMLSECWVMNCDGDGFHLGGGATLVGSMSMGNTGDGVEIDGLGAARLSDLIISGNGVNGLRCTSTSGTALDLSGSTIASNAEYGIEVDGSAVIHDVAIEDSGIAAIKTLAAATGCVIRDVKLSGSGVAIVDNGAGTVIRDTTINASGVSAVSLVTFGEHADVDGLSVDVHASEFSGPMLSGPLSRRGASIGSCAPAHRLRVVGEGVTADSFIARMGMGEGSALIATDCTIANAIATVGEDGTVLEGSIVANGTTTAPSLVRASANNCTVDILLGTLDLAAVSAALDIVGDATTVKAAEIKGVKPGSTALHIGAGAEGNELRNLSIAGSGAAIFDEGARNSFFDVSVEVDLPAVVASVAKFGSQAVVQGLTVQAQGGAVSGALVDASASGIQARGVTLNAAGVTAASALAMGANFDGFEWGFGLTNCTIATAIVDATGNGGALRGFAVNPAGSTTAPAGVRMAGDRVRTIDGEIASLVGIDTNLDCIGNAGQLQGVSVTGVGAGKTGVRIAGASTGSELRDVRVAGSGVALDDQGTRTVVEHLNAEIAGATASALVTLGVGAVARDLTVKAHNSTLGTAVLHVGGDGASISELRLAVTGTSTAPAAVRVSSTASFLWDMWFCGSLTSSGIPIGVDIAGTANKLAGAVVQNIPSGGIGVKVSGGGGNEIQRVNIGGSGAGPYTAVQLTTNNNLVVNNVFARLMGGVGVDNQGGAGNSIGPTVTAVNIGAATNAFANLSH